MHFLSRLVTKNLGDRVSSPALYFPWTGGATPTKIEDILMTPPNPRADVVVGGGGWLRHEALATLAPRVRRLALWGVGENVFDDDDAPRAVPYGPDVLLGVRDWPVPQDLGVRPHQVRWVPCASCLHPAFGEPVPEPVREVVVYDHYERPLEGWRQAFPAASNADFPDVRGAVRFIASGAYVVTNSYHGMYWATLLGRRVVCVPYASRFRFFRYPPVLLDPGASAFPGIPEPVRYPDALAECRATNLEFYGAVKAFFAERPGGA